MRFAPSLPSGRRRSAWDRAGAAAAFLALGYVWTVGAWVSDDAFITFRTVDNFVHGYGLTWNVDERVQAYTHPLWMLLVSACYAVTGEAFLTALALSLAFTLATLFVAFVLLRGDTGRLLLLALLLTGSKAFMDYTSSGLENPLSYFLVTVFLSVYFDGPEQPHEQAGVSPWLLQLTLLASLAFVNRMDTILVYLPSLVEGFWRHRPVVSRMSAARIAALGAAPAAAWTLFSLVYYGYPFPNTYYAKSAATGVSAAAMARLGVHYFLNSLRWDTITLTTIGAAAAAAAAAGRARQRMAMGGVVAYLAYVLLQGAAGTHMSGRFFSVPFLISALVVVSLIATATLMRLAAGAVIAIAVIVPASPWKLKTPFYHPAGEHHDGLGTHGIADVRYLASLEGTALVGHPMGGTANQVWYREGRAFRHTSQMVKIGGGGAGAPIGYFGYGAGPEKHVIDFLGLADPLLAHLPIPAGAEWAPGHFRRPVPDGYAQSIEFDENKIVSRPLHEYYDQVRELSRGPLFRAHRLRTIVAMNAGRYKPLVDEYARGTRRDPAEGPSR
jgi:arabinofuranosyltransferase